MIARYVRLASADRHAANATHGRLAATKGPLLGAVPLRRDGISSMKFFIVRNMKNTSALYAAANGVAYPNRTSSV